MSALVMRWSGRLLPESAAAPGQRGEGGLGWAGVVCGRAGVVVACMYVRVVSPLCPLASVGAWCFFCVLPWVVPWAPAGGGLGGVRLDSCVDLT